jgi:hypothetical protein
MASSKKAQAASVARVEPASPAADSAEFSREQELFAYREMLLIRRFEEKAGQLYGMGFIGGFCHLYIGQEAVVVGMQMAIEPGDQVITGYRDHGHMLACGMDAKGVMAELTGRRGFRGSPASPLARWFIAGDGHFSPRWWELGAADGRSASIAEIRARRKHMKWPTVSGNRI